MISQGNGASEEPSLLLPKVPAHVLTGALSCQRTLVRVLLHSLDYAPGRLGLGLHNCLWTDLGPWN